MPTIRKLPPSLVNKIAAGEVIERPASVVKELLENSIDAGATSLELTIEGGGMELIRLSDNGCGIESDQVLLAVTSHATSKLQAVDDLFQVQSLGFRGEALASIAEISHTNLRTRTENSDVGTELEVNGGVVLSNKPAGCPIGTTIEVRNLFFNTPVRKKFLRTPQTEANHVVEAFTRIALAFPNVQMKLSTGNRCTFDLPIAESWMQRIHAFFGAEIADSLMPVDSVQDDVQLSGFVADPSVSRSNNRMQYLFLNGRYIRDRSLQHALGEAYRGLLMTGRFPVCFLRLELPPQMVDVNVHPTKMEVRFLDGGKLYGQLLQTLRHQFLTSDLTARARHVPGPLPAGLRDGTETSLSDKSALGYGGPPQSDMDSRWKEHSDRLSQVTNDSGAAGKQLDLRLDTPAFRPFPQASGFRIGSATVLDTMQQGSQNTDAILSPIETQLSPLSDRGQQDALAHPSQATAPSAVHSHHGIQVHNRYLVTQDEDGMVVVDQHALHERILYEQLRQRIEQDKLESQKLLMPEPVDLSSAEAAAAIEFREVLAKIGIEVEAFGGDTILLTSYPAMLANMRPGEVLRQVLEPLMSGGKEPSARDVLDELLHMLACKAAIKAGDRLTPEEVTALLEQRYHFQDTHHCPHGRPTALHFSRQQLDKMFKRT